jgi:regulator of RNase E activity RraA
MVEKQPHEITLEMMRASLYSAVVCDALDGLGYRNQAPRVPLAAMTSDRVLVGRCKTTLWGEIFHTEENPYELELEAVDGCRSDDVLICAAGGSRRSGLWGELLSTAARNRGCVGAIVDGGVRDVAKMRRMEFPVFARSTCVYDSQHRQRVVAIDVPVQIDGVEFTPGDLVIADVDGVVVVPSEVEQQAVAKAWDKVHAEDTVRQAIAGGMKAGDAYRKYGVL